MNSFIDFFNLYETQVVFRVLLAAIFGTLVGLEREHAHRPAGLRTHVLVCVGSCLVMLTAQFTYNYYHQFSPNMDIARLGAQVISGVGFLGAGTIIRDGSSVKGLTTAASVWAVACIGLATGIGFYLGTTVATIIIFIFLAYTRVSFDNNEATLTLTVDSENPKDTISAVQTELLKKSIKIDNFSVKALKNNVNKISFQVYIKDSTKHPEALNNIYSLPGVSSVDVNFKKTLKEE
jgi:putative Mg2+ transporter-C (MgtC) family protein